MFHLSLFAGKKSDASRAEIISVTVSPDQPKKGDNVEITFKLMISMLNKLLTLICSNGFLTSQRKR